MARANHQTQGIIDSSIAQETNLWAWAEAFLVDRKVQNLSEGSIEFYRKKLKTFLAYCDSQVITETTQLTPSILRQFLLFLEETGHNPGGVHAVYRAVRAFLRWYEDEAERDNWRNPIDKVKAPKVPEELIEPAAMNDIRAMVETCQKGTFLGDRDRAILLCLLDTGARAQEFLDIQRGDVQEVSGSVLIKQGKGRKPRMVYLGAKSRRALRAYLKHRTDKHSSLWVREDRMGGLGYDGLRALIVRRGAAAGIEPPSLHDFRRAFAINMLRAGVDIYSLQNLMGHKSLTVLRRYLKLTEDDLQAAHRKGSPVDREF